MGISSLSPGLERLADPLSVDSGLGVEIDPHYCSVVLARWESFTGDKARKVKP